MGWRKTQLERNYLNMAVYKSKRKRKKKPIIKVTINTRNIKRTNIKNVKKEFQNHRI